MTFLKHITLLAIILLLFFACKREETKLTDLENGLIAHYTFDGDAEDKTSNQKHGITHKASYQEDRAGNPNSSIFFDGDSTTFYVPHYDLLNFQDEFTIAVWVKPLTNNPPFSDVVIAKGNLSASSLRRASFELSITQPLTYAFKLLPKSGPTSLQLNTRAPSADNWNHITAIFFNDIFSIYFDGDFVRSLPFEKEIFENNEPLTIGTILQYPTGQNFILSNWFKGNIDEVRLYNRALNFVEIKELHGL